MADPSALSFDMLDPGDDLAAQAIRSIFPTGVGGAAADGGTGAAGTVLGGLLGWLSAGVGLIMAVYITYLFIVQAMAAAESGRLLDERRSAWGIARIAYAALLLFPLANGFNAGQGLLSKVALSGLGLGVTGANIAVTQIGPGAQVINQPAIPGVKHLVSGLMINEICRALVNAAANNPGLVPAPAAATGPGYVAYSYDLVAGQASAGALCGSVTVRVQTGQGASGGVDMSAAQRAALDGVLAGIIRPAAEAVAQDLWTDRTAAAFAPLLATMQSATDAYTARLTAAAQEATSRLRAAHTLDAMRRGTVGGDTTAITDAGWSGLGAYYMGLARLSGAQLSLVGATPVVNTPSYQGIGRYLSSDVAALMHAALQMQARLQSYVATTDPLDAAAGGADLFSGATPPQDGASALEGVLRRMNFSERVLATFLRHLAPSQSSWADPFSALMQLGNTVVAIALAAVGASAVLASGAATTALTAWNVLTFNWAGAAATVTGHTLMGFLATPIFYGLMALLVPGLILGFVVPMVPAVLWTMGVLGWLIRYVEAMIAVPLWLFAHVSVAGEGIQGRGVRGWGNVFVLLVQPILMVIGLFASYWAFAWTFRLISMFFYTAALFTVSQGWLVANLAGIVVLLGMYVLLCTVAEVFCFRLISLISVHAPAWMGLDAADRVDSHSLAQDVTMIGMAGTVEQIRRGVLTAVPNGGTGNPPRPVLPPPNGRLGMDPTVAAASEQPPPTRV